MGIIKFEPKNFEELQKLSQVAIKSGLMPNGMTPEKFMIIAMKGAELGIPVLQAIQGINVINNKPAISAELMLALIYNRVPSAKITFKESSDSICTIEAQRTKDDNISEFTFSMVEADKAGLLNKSTWKQYPAAMLRARCISAMARAIFPDALMGASYTPEELGAEIVINEDGQELVKEQPAPPEKTNQQKWDELPEYIKAKFEMLAKDPEVEPRIQICAGLKFDLVKIDVWLNKLSDQRKKEGDASKRAEEDEELKNVFGEQ